jgi:hypothetical protein
MTFNCHLFYCDCPISLGYRDCRFNGRGRRGRDRIVVGFTLPMQSVSITTDVVSSNLDHGEMYNIM